MTEEKRRRRWKQLKSQDKWQLIERVLDLEEALEGNKKKLIEIKNELHEIEVWEANKRKNDRNKREYRFIQVEDVHWP